MKTRLCQFLFSIVVLSLSVSGAMAQQTGPPPLVEKPAPWMVSVIHVIDIDQLLRAEGLEAAPVDGQTIPVTTNITTGVVIDSRGIVLTRLVNLNQSAAEPSIQVRTSDGRLLTAKFLGADRSSGFALLEVSGLQIDPPSFAAVPVQAGQIVTVKSPEFSIRVRPDRGATSRAGTPGQTSFQILAQSGEVLAEEVFPGQPRTIAIGLPLSGRTGVSPNCGVIVNQFGELAGLTVDTHASRNGMLKRAIEIDQVRLVADKILAARKSSPRLWLGAVGTDLDQFAVEEREILYLPKETDGVVVTSVVSGSPAMAAGLKLNDVLVSVGDAQIHSLSDIQKTLASLFPNQKTSLKVYRDNKPLTLSAMLQPLNPVYVSTQEQNEPPSETERLQVKLRVMENSYRELSAQQQREQASRLAAVAKLLEDHQRKLEEQLSVLQRAPGPRALPIVNFGVTLQDLTPQLAEFFGVAGERGSLVTAVDPRGIGARVGLKAGDVILTIDDRPAAEASVRMPVQRRSSLTETHKLVVVTARQRREIVVPIVKPPVKN